MNIQYMSHFIYPITLLYSHPCILYYIHCILHTFNTIYYIHYIYYTLQHIFYYTGKHVYNAMRGEKRTGAGGGVARAQRDISSIKKIEILQTGNIYNTIQIYRTLHIYTVDCVHN